MKLTVFVLFISIGFASFANSQTPVLNIGLPHDLPGVHKDMKNYKSLYNAPGLKQSEIWNPTSREKFLADVGRQSKGSDTVLINYSGHIIRGLDGKAYIGLKAPAGTNHPIVEKRGIKYLDTTQPDAFKHHVAFSEVVKASGAKNVGGIIDACYAGACKDDLKKNCKGVNCNFIASASDRQTAGDGAFGQVVQQKARDIDKNGEITLGELIRSTAVGFRQGVDYQSPTQIKIGKDFGKDFVIGKPRLNHLAFGAQGSAPSNAQRSTGGGTPSH